MGPRAAGSWKLRPSVGRNRGAVQCSPARGLGKRSPQLPVAGCSVRLPPTGGGRGRGAMGPGRPAVENCGLQLRNRRGRFSAAPAGGFCKRSPQLLVAGRFVRFPSTNAGHGRGRWAPGRPAVGNCGLRGAKPPGRLGVAPARGLGRRSPQRPVAGRFVRLSPTGDGRGRGRWALERPAVGNCGLQLRNRQGGWV